MPDTPDIDTPDSTAPPAPAGALETQTPYRVLARKYRPANFKDLIGQEALVRTLTNALATGRLHHAFVLTGVRGVGKTTTARIIARALNCIGPDGHGGPTPDPCGVCDNCTAIAEDRHVDVIEMDAASRTGVNDIRDLIDGVRYRPSTARKKVYIVDEVHMLSNKAFNALLKTLEEPPEHVVFIFATTEIRKVPVTVLSRCQRFDLRRVDQALLAEHFRGICAQEGVEPDADALAMIARAADGSVRDGLSLLDQAIALGDPGGDPAGAGATRIEAEAVKRMLGLADRTRVYDLFADVMAGRTAAALALLRDLYDGGADPLVVLQDLLELTHTITRLQLVPEQAGEGLPEAERVRGRDLAGNLDVATLGRTWQMLLKGIEETQRAPAPLQAAEMVLIRLCYAADLPNPADLVRQLRDAGQTAGGGGATAAGSQSAGPRATRPAASPAGPMGGTAQATAEAQPAPMPAQETEARAQDAVRPDQQPQPETFEEIVALLRDRRELRLAHHLFADVRPVRCQPGQLEINPGPHAPQDLAGRLSRLLQEITGARWIVSLSSEPGAPSLAEREAAAKRAAQVGALAHPLVQAAMETFPGARLRRIVGDAPPGAAGAPTADDDSDPRDERHEP